MLAQAEEFLAVNTREITSFDEFKQVMAESRGFVKAFWCEKEDCERAINCMVH